MPKHVIELVKKRLRRAEEDYQARHKGKETNHEE